MQRARATIILAAALNFVAAGNVRAQEPRLVGRLPDAARQQVDAVLADARGARLPTEPLVDRALEGITKGAPPERVVAAVVRLRDELKLARQAFGDSASAAELTAGASALRAGATPDALAQLRALRPDRPLTVAAAVIADLVAAGVPVEAGLRAVLALAPETADADYIAFRRNVERDIALGASPVAAVGVRLRAAGDASAASVPTRTEDGGTRSTPRKRKP